MADNIEVRATGIREVANVFEVAGNIRNPQIKKVVLASLDKAADKILRQAKQRNYGFKDRSNALRRAISLQGVSVKGGLVARWVGVQSKNQNLNYYSRAVEYREGGKFSYLRRARSEAFNITTLAFDLAAGLSKYLDRRLG